MNIGANQGSVNNRRLSRKEVHESRGDLTDFEPTPFEWTDPADIPPRAWLYGHHYQRGQVSLTIAAGGTGKSTLSISESLAMCSGQPLLGDQVAGRLKVWIFNLEDSREELLRRVTAGIAHHQLDREDVEDQLYLDTGREHELCTAIQTRDGVTINRPVISNLERQIRRHQIDVLLIDPFISSHTVDENSNGAIDIVIKEWVRLAERCNCAIELVHHARKLNGDEGTSESGRGASALLAAVRSGRVLNRMSAKDRIKAGVAGEPATYFAINRDKSNFAPAGPRTWCRVAQVILANGDSVGVVEQWHWPGTIDGVKPEHLRTIQKMISKQCESEKPPRHDPQTGEAWAGNLVAKVLSLDPKIDSPRIKALLESWIKSGALRKTLRRMDDGKDRPCVEVGEWTTE